ncbi:DUF3788 family protein [Blautia pseudococcoides]|uniref:DUF3788 family protein n=1 Tax=Blautia pseudococcoides TaxID=1796616 RepID=UPI002E8E31B8|nr:DUF3788 family protein [Blautia pseudococcoides]
MISPSLEQVAEYINNPLWVEFNSRIQSAYQVKPCMEYSRCSMQAGWYEIQKEWEIFLHALSHARILVS